MECEERIEEGNKMIAIPRELLDYCEVDFDVRHQNERRSPWEIVEPFNATPSPLF